MPRVPARVRDTLATARTNGGTIDAGEANLLIAAADGYRSETHRRRGRTELRRLLRDEPDIFEPAARARLTDALATSPSGAASRSNGNKSWKLRADHRVWSTTYWPYADFSGNGRGRKRENLWADGGSLEKFDTVLRKRRKTTGAKDHEKTPALNWLREDGSATGYYIPKSTIREADAERTTGVDFTGNGSLRANVKRDFLDDFDSFGSNGKTTGKMDVGWWGSCDAVALAGQLFKEPKRTVTVSGVKFTPQDIKGLLTVIATSQSAADEYVGDRFDGVPDRVTLKSGSTIEGTILNMKIEDLRDGNFSRRGNMVTRKDVPKDVRIKTGDGKVRTISAARIARVSKEDIQDPAPALFHKTVKAWLRDKRPFAMDHDRGPHVWNDCYDGADIKKTRKVPTDVVPKKLNGTNGFYGGGDLCFYECRLRKGADVDKKYRYWVEKKDGRDVNSGWIDGRGFDENPDFLWRPTGDATFTGANPRNPFVLPKLVKEIYEKSI